VEEAERDNSRASNIRRVIEKEMREREVGNGWRFMAVTKGASQCCSRPRHLSRPRWARTIEGGGREEKGGGSRVLRDQWYPVKVDNACRMAISQEYGNLRAVAVEMLEKKNEVRIAEISWLSRKDLPKAYGSMVTYVTKRADTARLLEG